jgi:hypothetical protein
MVFGGFARARAVALLRPWARRHRGIHLSSHRIAGGNDATPCLVYARIDAADSCDIYQAQARAPDWQDAGR